MDERKKLPIKKKKSDRAVISFGWYNFGYCIKDVSLSSDLVFLSAHVLGLTGGKLTT